MFVVYCGEDLRIKALLSDADAMFCKDVCALTWLLILIYSRKLGWTPFFQQKSALNLYSELTNTISLLL